MGGALGTIYASAYVSIYENEGFGLTLAMGSMGGFLGSCFAY